MSKIVAIDAGVPPPTENCVQSVGEGHVVHFVNHTLMFFLCLLLCAVAALASTSDCNPHAATSRLTCECAPHFIWNAIEKNCYHTAEPCDLFIAYGNCPMWCRWSHNVGCESKAPTASVYGAPAVAYTDAPAVEYTEEPSAYAD